MLAIADSAQTTVEVIDGPTLASEWTGVRVTARDSDGFPIEVDVANAGQSFSATLEGGGNRSIGTPKADGGVGVEYGPALTQACTFAFDTIELNYVGTCTLPDTGIVGDWLVRGATVVRSSRASRAHGREEERSKRLGPDRSRVCRRRSVWFV